MYPCKYAIFCVFFLSGHFAKWKYPNPPLKNGEMMRNTKSSEGYINTTFHKKNIPNYKKNLHLNKIFVICISDINRIEKTKAKSAEG